MTTSRIFLRWLRSPLQAWCRHWREYYRAIRRPQRKALRERNALRIAIAPQSDSRAWSRTYMDSISEKSRMFRH